MYSKSHLRAQYRCVAYVCCRFHAGVQTIVSGSRCGKDHQPRVLRYAFNRLKPFLKNTGSSTLKTFIIQKNIRDTKQRSINDAILHIPLQNIYIFKDNKVPML